MSFFEKAKSFLKSEYEKLKKMSFKDKIWYIAEYYKFHLLFAGVTCFMVFSILFSVLTKKETVFHAVIINNPQTEYTFTEELTEDFRKHMEYDEKVDFSLEHLMISSGENAPYDNYMYIMKLQTYVGAKELDVILSDKTFIDGYSQQGFFANLEETLPPSLWEKVKDSAVYITDLETEQSFPAAIDISDTAFAKEYEFAGDSLLFSIVTNAPHAENSVAALEYILDLENK